MYYVYQFKLFHLFYQEIEIKHLETPTAWLPIYTDWIYTVPQAVCSAMNQIERWTEDTFYSAVLLGMS